MRARDGDIVEIDAGTYAGDVAVWTQRNLVIRGVGGTPRIDATGTSCAEGKATFVIRGDNVTLENVALLNCHVPDRNGAGIRHEAGRLVVRNVLFQGNENGILTTNDATLSLEVTDSQFIDNGYGDGYSHDIYVGRIGSFLAQGSYFTRAKVGHLIKSRAQQTTLLWNRITDETGTASYEVDLPNAGLAILVGNLIEQGPATENPIIVTFGEEGLVWGQNELYMAHNTVVNDRAAGGTFVRTVAGTFAKLVNNVFAGPGTTSLEGNADVQASPIVAKTELWNAGAFDYRLQAGSTLRGTAVDPGTINGLSLRPARQYVHPASSVPVTPPAAWSPGALQN